MGIGWVEATYTEVFSDDFDRADSTDIWNWWIESGSDRTLSWGQIWGTWVGRNINKPLLRPTIENISDGKVEFERVLSSWTIARSAVARYTGTNGNENYYLARILNNNQISITTAINGIVKQSTVDKIKEVNISLPNEKLKGEFIVKSLSSTETYLEFNVYNNSGVRIATATGTDTTAILQGTGQRGITSYGTNSYSSFVLYNEGSWSIVQPPIVTGFTFMADKETVKVWTPITYTLTASVDQIIALSDDKRGNFSSTSVNLNAGNSYTSTVLYTPIYAGNAIVTASGNDEIKISQVFVNPYSTVVGYIWDSITQGVWGTPNAVQVATNLLGTGFTAINRGVSGSTTKSWVNSILAGAITAFQNGGVEVISIMLWTNDSKVAENISVQEYKDNLLIIINQLKTAGFKKIILNKPPYIIPQGQRDVTSISKMSWYIAAIDELTDGEIVIYGDTQAYEYFEANQSELPDKIHPNTLWHQHLWEFRARAITGIFEQEINPNKQRLSGVNEHTLTTNNVLSLSIDKYLWEFENTIKINGAQIATGYLTTTWGTIITLTADYLNTLSAGTYSIEVWFYGGVRVDDTFVIKNKTITPPTSWWGGWWGSSILSKDNCPNGDFSPSYYDGTCGEQKQEDNQKEEEKNNDTTTPETPKTETNQEETWIENPLIVSDEILSAYDRAFKHNITTLAPLDTANPQGTVIRGHLAKMIVNYAMNILGRTLPEKVPAICYRKDWNNARESNEIKDYAIKACQLGLMGIDMEYFQPNATVTRAQFGTILSRLLWQNTYAGGSPYYVKHLQALKENGILTQIDTPESRVELRQRVWLMLMRSAK